MWEVSVGRPRIPRSVVAPALMAVARGATHAEAAALAGISVNTLRRRLAEEAVVVLRDRKPRPDALTLERPRGDPCRDRPRRDRRRDRPAVGRHRGTIGREIRADGGRRRYRAYRGSGAGRRRGAAAEAVVDRDAAVAVGRGAGVAAHEEVVARADRPAAAPGASRRATVVGVARSDLSGDLRAGQG